MTRKISPFLASGVAFCAISAGLIPVSQTMLTDCLFISGATLIVYDLFRRTKRTKQTVQAYANDLATKRAYLNAWIAEAPTPVERTERCRFIAGLSIDEAYALGIDRGLFPGIVRHESLVSA